MTADQLLTQQRPPDGTRPLELGRHVPFLEPTVATEQRTCFVADHARRYETPVHPDCRQVIRPGEHYLLHLQRDDSDNPTGRSWAYCAPCAVREAAWWDVREATA